jgi:hypothetical protein
MDIKIYFGGYMNQLLSFNGIFSTIIAALAIWIAYRQYRIARYKVKYDLYDKRFKIFELCRELIDKMITRREIEDEFFTKFITARNESYFLSNKEVSQQIDDFYHAGLYYRYYKPIHNEAITNVEDIDPKLIKLLNIDSNLRELDKLYLMTLFIQYGRKYFWNLNEIFADYLNFKKLY